MVKTMRLKTRRWLIMSMTLLLLGSGGITAWWFTKPLEKETRVPVFTCRQKAQVDYRVFFTPNNFFPDVTAGPGQAYITPLTQYVETTFKYSFSGDNPADISGQYEIDAKLTGYILVEDKQSSETVKRRVKAWEKIYPLIPATPFSRHDQKFGIKQVIPVDLRSYAAFADQVAKELKFSADIIELSITYHVLGSASTSQGKISEPVETILSIPVEGNSFIVNGKLADEKENSITIPGTESVPGVKTARTGWVVTTALLAILLLLIIFNTKAKAESPSERELRMIIKKHGDRIVAGVFSFTSVHDKNTTVLNSFYDLVKVADEVAQPILYENASDNLHSFYVINEPMIFSYSLEINTNENVYNNSQVITGS